MGRCSAHVLSSNLSAPYVLSPVLGSHQNNVLQLGMADAIGNAALDAQFSISCCQLDAVLKST